MKTRRSILTLCFAGLLLVPLPAQQATSLDVTLVGQILHQATFEALLRPGDPGRGFLHFREERRPSLLIPSFTGQGAFNVMVDTGASARQHITAAAAIHGWPLHGLFISGGSEFVPHFVIVRADFPLQSGPQDQRANRVQIALDNSLDATYHSQETITDPTDPDFGQTNDIRSFFAVTHFWNYRTDGLYTVRSSGVGDWALRLDTVPPGNWWQEFN